MNNRRKFFKQLGIGIAAIAGFSELATADVPKKLVNKPISYRVSYLVPNKTNDPQGIVSYVKDNGPLTPYGRSFDEEYIQELKRRGVLKPRYKIVFRNGSKLYCDNNPFNLYEGATG